MFLGLKVDFFLNLFQFPSQVVFPLQKYHLNLRDLANLSISDIKRELSIWVGVGTNLSPLESSEISALDNTLFDKLKTLSEINLPDSLSLGRASQGKVS